MNLNLRSDFIRSYLLIGVIGLLFSSCASQLEKRAPKDGLSCPIGHIFTTQTETGYIAEGCGKIATYERLPNTTYQFISLTDYPNKIDKTK